MKINFGIIILICMVVFGFLATTGTLTSGYHFTDDHGIITITNELKNESISTVAIRSIKNDLAIRFRPMYWLHRVIEAKIFGNNFTLWSVWTAILAYATFLFFYFGMRRLKYSITESVLFIILAFIGPQMTVWWRLGPAETIGMFFLGLSFYFLTNCEKRYFLNTFLFCLFLIFSSWCKESFTIIIPAFVVFKLWYEKNHFSLSLKEVLSKNHLLIIPLIVMCLNLWVIISVVGTNKIGYAGVDSDIILLIKGALKIIKNSFVGFIGIVILALCFIYYEFKDEKRFIQLLIKLIFPLIFALLIVVPNLILYAKSGMLERYLLPSTIGIAFLIVSLLRIINIDYRWLFKLLVVIILLIFAKPTYNMIVSARIFAKEGFQTNEMLSAIIKNSNGNSNILLVANPASDFEWSSSLKTYLKLEKNIQLYVYPINDVYNNDFEKGLSKGWHSWFKDRNFKDIKGEVDLIIFFDKNLFGQFCINNGILPKRYINLLKQHNNFAVYLKE